MFRHLRPVGILRVELEVLLALRAQLGTQLRCVVYDKQDACFYRVPEAVLQQLIFDNRQTPVARALTAHSPLRSWLRIGRFMWNSSRRTRSVRHPGPVGTEARDQIMAEELLRLSLEEFGMLHRATTRLGRVSKRFAERPAMLDSLNHRAHHGILTTATTLIRTPENRVTPADGPQHYITTGSFWSDNRYRHAFEMRRDHGWTVHSLIYDLVPILWRHVAEPHTREIFPLSLHWLLWGVDQIWTISETTKTDLLEHIELYGYPAPDPDWVKAVPLGCEIPAEPREGEAAQAWLAGQGLVADKYVLMVGTLEPRKNHDFAYRLWRELNLRHPGEVIPLVWVGQPGWAIAPLLEMVRNDHGLPQGAIRVLSNVDDRDLTTLYANCRYTIYPSHYEGWGLPVVESLNFGKPCLTSDTPALTEAAGGLNEAIGLFEGERWLARCFELMQDDARLDQAKERLADFEGYSWRRFRETIAADLQSFLTRQGKSGDPA